MYRATRHTLVAFITVLSLASCRLHSTHSTFQSRRHPKVRGRSHVFAVWVLHRAGT